MIANEILSTLQIRKTSYFVYSAFSAFADRGRKPLAGPWFVAALEPFGHSAAAVRQTLFRMSRDKELSVTKEGRTNYYRVTSYSRAEVEVGFDQIFVEPEADWDGDWTLVQYSFPDENRVDRDRMRSLLEVMGFAPLGHGVHIHPRDCRAKLKAAIGDQGLTGKINVFRGQRDDMTAPKDFAHSLWDLKAINGVYKAFLDKFQSLEAAPPLSDQEAFGVRFALVFDYLEAAWQDPDLPGDLLGDDWLGGEARRLASKLYDTYLPQAKRHAETLF